MNLGFLGSNEKVVISAKNRVKWQEKFLIVRYRRTITC